MSRSNFVELIAVNNSGIELGTMLIMPEDVCRVVPFTQNTTNLVVDDNEHDVKHYLVRGSSTEVFEKLFGKSNDQKLKEELEHYKAQNENLVQRNYKCNEEVVRLKEENDKYAELFKQTSQTEGELRDELVMVKNMHSGQRTIIERMQTEAQALVDKIKALDTELDKLKSQFIVSTYAGDRNTSIYWKGMYDVLLGQSKSISDEVRALREQVKDLESHEENCRKERDRLSVKLNLMKLVKGGDKEKVEAQVRDLSRSNMGLRMEYNNLVYRHNQVLQQKCELEKRLNAFIQSPSTSLV